MLRIAVIASCVLNSWGCDILGPSCVARQERGSVAFLTGHVEAGATVSHLVRYEPSGSQNDATVQWDGDRREGGPRLGFYATHAACAAFDPAAPSGECAVIARAGSLASGSVATTLIVTHGRGNPERLGNPPEYKIWVVGDPGQPANYTIAISWFFGPDC